uniref:Uncharacterized protein n=1 Tax=Anguilla anguilla TaxID=7936 RepID=A0A0E9T939_ANGAN
MPLGKVVSWLLVKTSFCKSFR